MIGEAKGNQTNSSHWTGFLYGITDLQTGMPLFIGIMEDPACWVMWQTKRPHATPMLYALSPDWTP
jgi:hypothetical protein